VNSLFLFSTAGPTPHVPYDLISVLLSSIVLMKEKTFYHPSYYFDGHDKWGTHPEWEIDDGVMASRGGIE